jgi:hypothetical protein
MKVEVDNKTNWGPIRFTEHESRELPINESVKFSGKAEIKLVEVDDVFPGDSDDVLGKQTVGEGKVEDAEFEFARDDANYTLYYSVK